MMRWLWWRKSSIAVENGTGKTVRFSGLRAFFTEQSLRLLRGCIFLSMLGLLFLLARPSGSSYLRGLEEGAIPSRTIKAAFPFEYEDEEKTNALRSEAAARVPPVYQVVPGIVEQTSSTYASLVSRLGELGQISQDGVLLRTWIADLEENLNITLDNREYKNVASAIVGASRPEQLDDNVKAAGVVLDADTLKAIDKVLDGVIISDPRRTESPKTRP